MAMEKEAAMTDRDTGRKSVLAARIAAGLADPISDEEIELAAKLRAGYEKKYGPYRPESKRRTA